MGGGFFNHEGTKPTKEEEAGMQRGGGGFLNH
jgi:hypothetical protein